MLRNWKLDIMKGTAIALVVLGHVISNVYAPDHYADNILFRVCYSFHMALFFFISAYLDGSRTYLAPGVIKKKTCRLLIPHFVWTAFEWHRRGCGDDLFEALFVNPYLWFLLTLYLCFAIVFISEYAKRKLAVVTVSFCIFCCGYILMRDACQTVKNVTMFFPIYLGGYYSAKYRERLGRYSGYARASLILYPVSMFFYTFKEYDEVIPVIQQIFHLGGAQQS